MKFTTKNFTNGLKLGFFLLIIPVFLPAQTAGPSLNELEAVLASPALTCAQAARFVAASVGSGGTDAFERALANGWFPRETVSDDPITLGKLSFLVMQAFDIKGGLLYTIFPSQRYAFRTMVSRSLIQGATDPAMTVSGQRFLHILGNTLSLTGGE
ncbi:MAG: hypothetical protein FWG99_03335 [Treponema sp.]|nr:hypothetical protein [Treponema sp.]